MATPALLLIVATLLPLASFVLLVFIGRRLGNPLAGWVATVAIAGSFGCSLAALISWVGGSPEGVVPPWGMGQAAINVPIPWVPAGEGLEQTLAGFLDLGVYVDSLTIAMFLMVSGVSSLIHIFSIGYMAEDPRFPRFFTYLSLFCFSMLGLVLGGTLLQLFVFWELVGLCSYLLIGFWYERKSASNAAIKAFVVNRIGDFGFLIGFGILFYHLGNVTLPSVWGLLDASQLEAHGAVALPGGAVISAGLLTIVGICLFFGAVGKSAQFPLHVWLPDAMEGPTPVSALIHAATMVAAGVYLVGRIFPILTPEARLFIAIIGVTTLTMAALIALAQSDIKKVLAYSTLSQLGYMILAMGIGSWVGALFHLITHAYFKALLFLGSGSVIHAAHHEQDMSQYGGLIRKIPITGVTFGIAVLSISGFNIAGWGFSGFFSKDMILGHAAAFGFLGQDAGAGHFWWLFILPTAIAYVTAFYMTRCWMLTFWGRPRNQHLYDHAREAPIMYGPLLVLAGLSMFAGYEWMGVNLIRDATAESTAYVQRRHESFAGFSRMWPGHLAEHGESEESNEVAAHGALERGSATMHRWVGPAWIVGIGLGVLVYLRGYTVANRLMKIAPLRWIHTWLYRRMYFDELYMGVFVLFTIGLARLSRAIDTYVIDGLVHLGAWITRRLAALAGRHDEVVVDGVVSGVAELAQGLGAAARMPQTGRIRLYVTVLLGFVALGVTAAIVIALVL
jgi:NADH-quinone oxidoreductase subunit L